MKNTAAESVHLYVRVDNDFLHSNIVHLLIPNTGIPFHVNIVFLVSTQ